MFPLLFCQRRLGAAGATHPRIDLIFDAVVVRRTKKQLTHTIVNLLANGRFSETIGEFAKKWFDVCDEAN
jgi:hypothetical protein